MGHDSHKRRKKTLGRRTKANDQRLFLYWLARCRRAATDASGGEASLLIVEVINPSLTPVSTGYFSPTEDPSPCLSLSMQIPAAGFPGVVSRRRHQVMEGELKFVTEQIWPPVSGDSFESLFGSQCKVHAKSPFGFPKQMPPLQTPPDRARQSCCKADGGCVRVCACVCLCVEFGFHFHKPFLSQQPPSSGGQSACTSNYWQLNWSVSSHFLFSCLSQTGQETLINQGGERVSPTG